MSKSKTVKQDFSSEKQKYLQILTEHLSLENETLKHKLKDMYETALHNKQLLKENIDKITEKDLIIQKLQNKIDNLIERIRKQGDSIKKIMKENQDYKMSLNINKNHLKTEENRGFDLLNKSYEPSNIDMNNFNNHSMNKEIFYSKQNKIFNELHQLKKNVDENYKQLNDLITKKDKEHLNHDKNQISVSHFSSNSINELKFILSKNIEKASNLQSILNDYLTDSMILILDTKNNFWEIIRREDLKDPKKLKNYVISRLIDEINCT